jgi:uncharacterized protein (TIGR02145 family)
MLNFINNKFRNNKFRKIKDLNLKKIGLTSFVWIFCATLFLSGSNFARGGTSAAALPISFGGTGASTQAGALTNLGINNTLDENSSNSTFPSAEAVYDYMKKVLTSCDNSIHHRGNISSDNTNFYNNICSWTGGDLIYKGSGLSATAANNKIKVGDKACTTSGQGYTSNSAAGDSIPQVGCVLPNLAAGTHAVTVSTDGGTNYTINAGTVVYQEDAKLSNCDTTSMQTFGASAAACKAAMQQGQVIILNDTRNNQKYRVKKMPDGNVWMIDNLQYSGNYNPSATTYCNSTGLVNTHNPGNTTACGYLYKASSTSTPPSGWFLHPNTGTKSAYELNEKMLAAAADTAGNRNPVYSATNYKNFCEGGTGFPAPWLGVYSGFTNGTGGFYNQGSTGHYRSIDTNSSGYAYDVRCGPSYLNTQFLNDASSYGLSIRSVL